MTTGTLSILEEISRISRSHLIPYHVLLELTYGCNLRCVMCYNPTHEASPCEVNAAMALITPQP